MSRSLALAAVLRGASPDHSRTVRSAKTLLDSGCLTAVGYRPLLATELPIRDVSASVSIARQSGPSADRGEQKAAYWPVPIRPRTRSRGIPSSNRSAINQVGIRSCRTTLQSPRAEVGSRAECTSPKQRNSSIGWRVSSGLARPGRSVDPARRVSEQIC